MWEQIRSNRRKAALLVVCMALLLFVLGWVGVGVLLIVLIAI